ncbi:MAG TPA: AAA family ATPase [Hanamia sp.]|nr:AAA family ATPase [Hanamia sp.]
MIQNLTIKNYKSIDQLNLDCSRINVFIGQPNSGKSNILEALDLSYLSWIMGVNKDLKKSGISTIDISSFFRASKVADLFRFGNLKEPISIVHPGFSQDTFIEANFDKTNDKNFFEFHNSNVSFTNFDNSFSPLEPAQFYASPIKPYRYQSNLEFHDIGNYIQRLMPPFGNNLASVIYHNSDMQQLINNFAKDHGFDFIIDNATGNIAIQLRISEGVVYSLPYEALADTYKRMLFFIAAVRHTNGSVITLDEPDTHAFPPYVSFLADEIIKQTSVQFFIATHNPYLLNTFIENTPVMDFSIFIVSYDKNNRATVAKKLSENDLSELLDFGVDIFFNLNRYSDGSVEYSS